MPQLQRHYHHAFATCNNCVACVLEYATDLYINSLSCYFIESESAVSTRSTRQQRYLARNQPRASTPTHTCMDIDASPVIPQSPSNLPSTSAQHPLQPVNIPSTSTPLTGMRTNWSFFGCCINLCSPTTQSMHS